MRKGTKIGKCIIDENGQVMVYDTDGGLVKLTRYQRNLMKRYHDSNFIDSVIREFGNANVLDDVFEIVKCGKVVYNHKK